MVAVSARMVVVMVAPLAAMSLSPAVAAAAVVVVVVVVAVGVPGWGASGSAALAWRRTKGPSWPSFRHQRVPEADTRRTLATKGVIIWVQGRMARGFCGWLRGTAEPQFGHRMAVRGPSQKVGGLFSSCS